MIKLGAHQSISGGYSEALKRVNNIGGNCLQIFSSSPRGWNFAKPTEEEINQFAYLKKIRKFLLSLMRELFVCFIIY